ncbi:MAG TPA: hypothetical protein VHD81_04285 [Mycobacteriales bacterium]|nr:hypothetical protein [Mycobacteriales bacterium]
MLMWAVVLVPMWLKRHDEVEETRSVDRFTAAMHTLSRYDDNQREATMSHRGRDLDVHVSGASAPDAKAARRRRGMARRRARSLAVLALTGLVVLVLAIVTGSVLAWAVQLVLDVSIVSFVVHLRRMATQAAAARRRAARRRQDRRQLDEALAEPSYAEPQWEEGVTIRRPAPSVEPVYVGSAARAAFADDVFDQTAEADDVLVTARAGASDGFFDQETDLATTASAAPSFIEAGAQRPTRVVEREEVPAAPVAEPIGGSEWEPKPVPRPTYAMKPPAPQRPVRRRPAEPILPPVEPVAEVEADDDLEAILDRRWAVND